MVNRDPLSTFPCTLNSKREALVCACVYYSMTVYSFGVRLVYMYLFLIGRNWKSSVVLQRRETPLNKGRGKNRSVDREM